MKRKEISITQYNKLLAKIIAKGKPVAETLIELLEEAGKYDLINDKRKKR